MYIYFNFRACCAFFILNEILILFVKIFRSKETVQFVKITQTKYVFKQYRLSYYEYSSLNIIFAPLSEKFIMSKINRNSVSNFMHWLGLLTAATFVILGIYILYSDNLNGLEKTTRVIFSIFFFALGFFRIVNWVLKNKSRKIGEYANEDDN